MAKFLAILGDLRGKLAGNVFSKNRNGAYIRQKVTPVNPQSADQISVRSKFSQASSAWSSVLNAAERQAWTTYANGTPLVDVFGNSYTMTGAQAFIRTNSLRLGTSLGILTTAPVVLGEAPPVDFTQGNAGITISAADDEFSVVNPQAAGFNEGVAGEVLFVYVSPVLQPGQNFFNGPYKHAVTLVGAVTPPTLVDLPLPMAVAAGDRVKFLFRYMDTLGRLSPTSYLFVTAA